MNNFDSLPQECIAHILSLTSPRDVSRSSAVSHTFLAAADSDSAWEKFLPAEYDHLRSTSSAPPPSIRKKDAYLDLCDNPILLEGGLMSLSLERCSGKKCFMIGSRSLDIIWGDNPQYWTWSSKHASRFSEVAELRLVCWLEISGNINTQLLSPNTNYSAYFVFNFNEQNYGFENLPVDVSLDFVRRGGGGGHTVFLDPHGKFRDRCQLMLQKYEHLVQVVRDNNMGYAAARQLPWKREDGWMEVELGKFCTAGSSDDESDDVAVKFMQVKRLNAKFGLLVHGVEFRPTKTSDLAFLS